MPNQQPDPHEVKRIVDALLLQHGIPLSDEPEAEPEATASVLPKAGDWMLRVANRAKP
jgi:hypothetical protein